MGKHLPVESEMTCDLGIVIVTYNSYHKLGSFFIKVLKSLTELDINELKIIVAEQLLIITLGMKLLKSLRRC